MPVDTHVHQLAARHYLPQLRHVKTLTDRAYREVADHFRKVFGERAGWAQAVGGASLDYIIYLLHNLYTPRLCFVCNMERIIFVETSVSAMFVTMCRLMRVILMKTSLCHLVG